MIKALSIGREWKNQFVDTQFKSLNDEQKKTVWKSRDSLAVRC